MNRTALIAVTAVAAAWLAGCDDTVPPEELDNDRIIAVRATPPHIPAGGESTLDAFVTMMGSGPAVVTPLIAQLPPETPETPAAPAGLRDAVVNDGGTWKVVASSGSRSRRRPTRCSRSRPSTSATASPTRTWGR